MLRYPATERDNGREGGIVAAIVVNAAGRVDITLTSFLYASAEPFETAVREAFGQMRSSRRRSVGSHAAHCASHPTSSNSRRTA